MDASPPVTSMAAASIMRASRFTSVVRREMLHDDLCLTWGERNCSPPEGKHNVWARRVRRFAGALSAVPTGASDGSKPALLARLLLLLTIVPPTPHWPRAATHRLLTLANPGSSPNQASPLWLSRKSRKTTRDLKPAPWGGFGYTRTREISDPKPPRNQNPKRDSSKALKRRFSQTVIHLAARG